MSSDSEWREKEEALLQEISQFCDIMRSSNSMKEIRRCSMMIYNTTICIDHLRKEEEMNFELKVGDRIVVVTEPRDHKGAPKGTKGVITSIGTTYVSFDTDDGESTRKRLINVRPEDYEQRHSNKHMHE